MSSGPNSPTICLVLTLLAAFVGLPGSFGTAIGEEAASPEKIIEALKPARVTRGELHHAGAGRWWSPVSPRSRPTA